MCFLAASPSFIYHVSIWSGLLLSCACGSFLILVPVHNVMEEPNYWYMDQTYRFLAAIPIMTCQTFVRAKYWSNFSVPNTWQTYLMIIGAKFGVFLAVSFGYSLTWIYYLEFSPPIPMNQHLAAIPSFIAINIAIWFR